LYLQYVDTEVAVAGVKEEGRRFETGERSRAKLFMHGGSQAVRLPKAFRFEGDEVEVRKEGDSVILQPVRPRLPNSEAERAAFWARLDTIRGDHVLGYPPRDDDFFGPDPILALSDRGHDDQP
jgi:antitoxin VapB